MVVKNHKRGNIGQRSSHFGQCLFQNFKFVLVFIGRWFIFRGSFRIEGSYPIFEVIDKFCCLLLFFRRRRTAEKVYQSTFCLIFLIFGSFTGKQGPANFLILDTEQKIEAAFYSGIVKQLFCS